MAEQEYRQSTLQKRYTLKKIVWDFVVDSDTDVFNTTKVPQALIDAKQRIISGNSVIIAGGGGGAGGGTSIDITTFNYLIELSDQTGTYSSATTITVNAQAAINPNNNGIATKNEFDIYINGQYIDKVLYTWTPSDIGTQSIVFDTSALGYSIESTDTIIINGRWSTS